MQNVNESIFVTNSSDVTKSYVIKFEQKVKKFFYSIWRPTGSRISRTESKKINFGLHLLTKPGQRIIYHHHSSFLIHSQTTPKPNLNGALVHFQNNPILNLLIKIQTVPLQSHFQLHVGDVYWNVNMWSFLRSAITQLINKLKPI